MRSTASIIFFSLGWRAIWSSRPFGDDAALDAAAANLLGDVVQGQRLGHRGTSLGDLAGDVLMGVGKLLGQAEEAVGFLERRQVLALEIFNQAQFEGFSVVRNFLDARQFAQTRLLSGMEAAFAGDDVVGVFTRNVANEQRLEHALLADGIR